MRIEDNELLTNYGIFNIFIMDHLHVEIHILIYLIEWWEPDLNIYHLPNSEMNINLEDIHHI